MLKSSKTQILLFILIAIIIIRCICVLTMGLTPQDAYYYYYSEEFSLSYFDHPPMIAWLLKIFTLVFGKQVWVIKMADFTITLLSLYAFYYLAGMFLSKSRRLQAILLLGSTFLITIISISSGPDVPLIFFWTISLIFLCKAIFEDRAAYWILSGIAIGFTFDSKYTAVFLLFGLFLFLFFSKKYRHYLFSKYSLMLLVSFLIAILPVVIWNIRNDFVSFKFQTGDRAAGFSLRDLTPLNLLGTVGHQLFLLLPVFLVSLFIIFWKLGRRVARTGKMLDDRKLFLTSFSLPILVFFFTVAIIDWVKINWMMPAYISAAILVAVFLQRKYLRTQLLLSLFLHIIFIVQIVLYPVAVKSDDTWWGWDKLNGQVNEIQNEYPGYFIFSNDGYKTTAILNFYNHEVYAGNVLGENALEFSIRDKDLSRLIGRNAIYIDSEPRFTDEFKGQTIPPVLQKYFSSVKEIDPIILKDDDSKALRKFRMYKCENYQAWEEIIGKGNSIHIMKPFNNNARKPLFNQ